MPPRGAVNRLTQENGTFAGYRRQTGKYVENIGCSVDEFVNAHAAFGGAIGDVRHSVKGGCNG